MVSPVAIFPAGGSINRMIDKALTDFPDPDSPTTPKRSPSWMVNEMPSTARTIPSSVEKYVRRLLTCRRTVLVGTAGGASSFRRSLGLFADRKVQSLPRYLPRCPGAQRAPAPQVLGVLAHAT